MQYCPVSTFLYSILIWIFFSNYYILFWLETKMANLSKIADFMMLPDIIWHHNWHIISYLVVKAEDCQWNANQWFLCVQRGGERGAIAFASLTRARSINSERGGGPLNYTPPPISMLFHSLVVGIFLTRPEGRDSFYTLYPFSHRWPWY